MTQSALARAVGVTQRCVSQWESHQRGFGGMHYSTAYPLASALGWRIEDIAELPLLERTP